MDRTVPENTAERLLYRGPVPDRVCGVFDYSSIGGDSAMSKDTRTKKTITYTYRGGVERGPRYDWHDGYSETGPNGEVYFPWMTRSECQRDARSQGAQAIFYTPPGPGAKRFEPEVQS